MTRPDLTVARMRAAAQRRGNGPTQLVRQWVSDRLAAAEKVPAQESREEVRAMVRRHHAAVEAAIDGWARRT
ncbi:MAG: hypothetical protein ACYCZN_00355 [Candidatus Dormibacteria bacterium]